MDVNLETILDINDETVCEPMAPEKKMTPEMIEWCQTLDGDCIRCKWSDEGCPLSKLNEAQ